MKNYDNTVITFCSDRAYPIQVAVPQTEAAMERGLQHFTKLPDGSGMLFRSNKWPKPEKIPMWQASVHYRLAMIFLGVDGRISTIDYVEPGDPKTYEHMALACLEMPAESAIKRKLAPGTPWEFGGQPSLCAILETK